MPGHNSPLTQLTRTSLLCFCLAFTSVETNAQATLYYRYKDGQGQTVLSNILPPDAVGRGYQVVDRFGQVIEEVAPALTPEQIAERDRRLAEEARRKEAARLQAEQDAALLRQYPTPDDAIRARDRRLAEIEALIIFKSNSIQSLEKKIGEQEASAANFEKTGRAVPQVVLDNIVRDRARRDELAAEVAVHIEDKASVETEFNGYIQRLNEIISRKDTP